MKKTIPPAFDGIYTIILLSYPKTISLVLVLAWGLIVSVANADFTFGKPQNFGPVVNSSFGDGTPGTSADGLILYFSSNRPGGLGRMDLWMSTRQSTNDPWDPSVNLTTVNSEYSEGYPSISSDGLTLYFSDVIHRPDRPGGQGGHDLWVAMRTSTADPWGTPVNLGSGVNSSTDEQCPTISHDGLTLIFASTRGGGSGNYDLWMSTRTSTQQDWGKPVNLGPFVNSSSYDQECCLSCDGLALFFMSERSGGLGGSDAWVTLRRSINDPWGPPVNLGPPVNTSVTDGNLVISTGGRMLYFASNRLGGIGDFDIWQAPVIRIVDFNGDGIAEAADMCIMVDYWGTDEPLCDIGPMPWGDGIVDVEDLKVLAEHLFEEVEDSTLIAHWPLNETQGVIAYDSAAENDGILVGDPVWQSDGGVVAGALQFDGVDDYISTDFVFNPADGAFSVLAWVKGGAASQVILSQADGANWLCTDLVEGYLMTELKKDFGRFKGDPLSSEGFITDGNWHRIGFVWDCLYRYLYVDGVEVANDVEPLSGLNDAYGGLHIGTGSNCAEGTFFSGLIDDVRIYNRAVKP